MHTVYFDNNKYVLTAKEQNRLEALSVPGIQIYKIAGHTDTVGNKQANILLSYNRAAEVRKFFADKSIAPDSSAIVFFGEDSIVSTQDNSKNRRVEIFYSISVNQEPVTEPKSAKDSGVKILETRSFDKIYFLPDRAVIDPESYQYVAELLRYIQSYPDKNFEIRGHVNLSRRFNKNPESEFFRRMQNLSEDRARLIYEILIEKGISPGRLRFRGMGNLEMVVPDARTEAEMRRNMRVEVVVFE